MKVKIEIECDYIEEILAHVSVIRSQIKSEAKKRNITPGNAFEKRVRMYDNNCYGDHKITIYPDN